jgi:quinol monooxygenase YgiN
MAIGMLQSAEMFTKEIYDQVSEKMFGHSPMRDDEAPEGLILHSAGQGEGGWYVYDIWESREAFERFMESKLMPAVQEVMGDRQPPPEAAPQFFPVEVLVVKG